MNKILPIFLLLLGGCSQPFEPDKLWVEFHPPQQYNTWHQEIEVCVGIQRAFDDIVWRTVYAETFRCAGDLDRAGGCFIHPHTIYLANWLLDYEGIVKAELLHYVRYDISHDDLFYQCGGY